MGRQKGNYIMKGASGKLNNQIVFKQVNGNTILAKVPAPYNVKSEKRKAANERFRQAVLFAKKAMHDPELKEKYQQFASKDCTARNLALGDFLDIPKLQLIITANYTGIAGSTITAFTQKGDFIKEVKMTITSANGTLIENGIAIPDGCNTQWTYIATKTNLTPNSTVSIEVTDFAGNTSTEVAELNS